MEIEISVVTAGQWRNLDKQPTVREHNSLKQTLALCLYTPADCKEIGPHTQKQRDLLKCECVSVCVCEPDIKDVGGGSGEHTAAEPICRIHSLRNGSRILLACVATCQNLSS